MPRRTSLSDLFGTYAVDRALFERVALSAWPVMQRVDLGSPPDPTSHPVLTAQVTGAITRATGADARRIVLVSTGADPFMPGRMTDYGAEMRFDRGLAFLLMERWRPHFTRRSQVSGCHLVWTDLKQTVWSGLIDMVGEEIAGRNFGSQMAGEPRSSTSDAYLAILLCYFSAGLLGDEGAVNQLKPLLDLAPVVIPIGQTEEDGTWRCTVVGTPLIIKSL